MRPEPTAPPATDLGINERSVEVPWACQHVGGARCLLDVGCSTSDYLADLARTGPSPEANPPGQAAVLPPPAEGRSRRVYGLDPGAPQPIRNVGIVKGTIVVPPFPADSFDLILCISTVEHIGLPVYGQHEFPHGDILAMRHVRRLLAPGGRLLLTVPFGRAQVNPWFRVYDRWGLRRLTRGFRTLSAAFYRLRPEGEGPSTGSGCASYEACRASDLRRAGYDFEHMRAEGVVLAELTPSGRFSFLLARALTRLGFWFDRLVGKERPFLRPS
jgi:SAM-dependent methyltransferase